MKTRPNNTQTKETADTQNAAPVASIRLDNVTGGYWYGPNPYYAAAAWGRPWAAPGGPGPYGYPPPGPGYGYGGWYPPPRRGGYGPWGWY